MESVGVCCLSEDSIRPMAPDCGKVVSWRIVLSHGGSTETIIVDEDAKAQGWIFGKIHYA